MTREEKADRWAFDNVEMLIEQSDTKVHAGSIGFLAGAEWQAEQDKVRAAKTYCMMCNCQKHKDVCKYGTNEHSYCKYIKTVWMPNYEIALEHNSYYLDGIKQIER